MLVSTSASAFGRAIRYGRTTYTGRNPAGPEARPAAAIVISPGCAPTGLPLNSVQFMSDRSASRKCFTKLPQKSMLREFAKAYEAKIWTRVRRQYLTSFAGLHFENEPGLTKLDAAEGRRNRRLYLKRGNESSGNTIAM